MGQSAGGWPRLFVSNFYTRSSNIAWFFLDGIWLNSNSLRALPASISTVWYDQDRNGGICISFQSFVSCFFSFSPFFFSLYFLGVHYSLFLSSVHYSLFLNCWLNLDTVMVIFHILVFVKSLCIILFIFAISCLLMWYVTRGHHNIFLTSTC